MSAFYAKYVSTPIHPAEFPQKISSQTNPELIIFAWYSYVSLFPDLLCYRLECQRFTQNTFQRLYTKPNFHKKSVLKQTRISVVQVNNFSLVSLRFSVPRFIVLSVWVPAVYAKYVLTPTHPSEFPQKNQFSNKPGFPLSKLIILVWYPYVSLFPDLLCYRLECQRFTQNTFQRLYTPPNFHKKSVLKQTRIPVVQVNNFSLVSLRFSVPWFIVLSAWVSAVYAKHVLTPIHSAEFSQKISSQTNQDFGCPS